MEGSHLGPLLFNIFVNDITSVAASRFLLFADDIKLFHRVTSSFHQDELQRSIDSDAKGLSHIEVVFSYGYAINRNKLKTVDESASPLHQSSLNKAWVSVHGDPNPHRGGTVRHHTE
ncbi:hypothetical protein J6590_105783 [Homalodisca vitripennis]|nr:hypothetical protein J6590_105783 [Homalodisca vitripennis]